MQLQYQTVSPMLRESLEALMNDNKCSLKTFAPIRVPKQWQALDGKRGNINSQSEKWDKQTILQDLVFLSKAKQLLTLSLLCRLK
jgi:hypothetical protein